MHANIYLSIVMSWADSAARWTDFVPGAIHNQVATFDRTLYVLCACFYIITDFVSISN